MIHRLGSRPTAGHCVSLVLSLFVACAAFGSDCNQTTTGLIPLHDLGANSYQGFLGGLYPDGLNTPPAQHHFAGRVEASKVVPRDAAGQPAADGKIVMLSIGMSNASKEFSTFIERASSDPQKNPKVVLVNGAQGGQTADVISDPNAPYWTTVMTRLAQAGVTSSQVQVIWLLEAVKSPSGGFPLHAMQLRDDLKTISVVLHDKFPNARLCYLASRIYAGYASISLNPEPYSYEQGFAVKWLIEAQIAGDPALNFQAGAPVKAPWLGWGTYNWADGLSPRSDGLVYTCADFESDGTHPSNSGAFKVAVQLIAFLKTDATAKVWFLKTPTLPCAEQAVSTPYGSGFGGQNGQTSLVLSDPPQLPTVKTVFAHAWGAPANATGAVIFGFQPLPDGQVWLFGASLVVNPLIVLPIVADGFGKAWLPLGTLPADPVLCGKEVYFQLVAADPDSPFGYDVTPGLRLRFGG